MTAGKAADVEDCREARGAEIDSSEAQPMRKKKADDSKKAC